MTAESEVTLKQALAYASYGWPVFPCRPGGKEPATRHGFHDATTDPAQIKQWWKHKPAANLAIATGLPGPDVLDVDQRGEKGSGFAPYGRLLREGLLAGVSAIVATPGGGLHAYFAGSDQASARIPQHHLDFKSGGGYVLAPPSRVNGKPYRLLFRQAESGTLDWLTVASVLEPERRSLAWPGPSATGDVSHLTAWVERLREGNRNSGLFWAACRSIEAGQSSSLDDLAAAAARAGLDDREIVRTIASAMRASQRTCQHQAEREGAR